MAFLPASVEKLLGLYLLGRVTLDLFVVEPGSWASHLLIGVGAVGLVLGGLFALVQRDLKRLLVLQSVSQAGLMILAIGTAAPLAIAGAMFQLLNHVTYKTCLFFAAGAVERQAGSTDLYALGALRKRMPITFVCFLVASASMAGLPPLAGFFSKELVYDGLLESGYPLYAVALVGSFLTVAAVLRVGHAVFFGEQSESSSAAKEAPAAMLAPMVFLAGVAALFGLANALPVQRFVLPMLPERVIAELHGHHLTGWPANAFLVIVTAAVVLGAIVNHAFGAHLNAVGPAGEPGAKGGAHAAEHVERAPVLGWLFTKAAEGRLDPYELFMRAATLTGRGAARVHAGVDWVYVFAGKLAAWCSTGVRLAHTGNTSSYVVWSLLGAALVLSMLFGWS
jgi:NADH-quinone oxidoreductase subunit L